MFLDRTDLCVMEELCENSRSLLTNIAEKAGVSIQTVSSRMKRLESALGLKYALELDLDMLGLQSEHVVKIKFREGRAPSASELAEAAASPCVQLACRTTGEFDFFMWVVTPTMKYFSSEVEPAVREALGEEVEDWTSYPIVARTAGFIPVGAELCELFKVPKSRSKTIRIMSQNARISVRDLAEQLGVTEPTAEYHLKKMKPFVRRFTAYFTGRGEFAHVIRFMQLRGRKADIEAEEKRITGVYLNSDPRLFNRLAYAARPAGGMDAVLLETYSSFDDCAAATEQVLGGGKFIGKHSSAAVSSVVKGAIPIRKVCLQRDCASVISPAKAAVE